MLEFVKDYLPLLIVGGIIGAFTGIFIIAYAMVRNKKEAMGFERNMDDSEIIRRLMVYAKPHWKSFLLVLFIMMFSIAYDIVSPIIVGNIEEMIDALITADTAEKLKNGVSFAFLPEEISRYMESLFMDVRNS